MAKKTYSEKLRDPRWQRKRLEILERDNWSCCYCGNTEMELHVHHIKYTYGDEPWDHDNNLLKTLCKDCHHWETEFRKEDDHHLVILLAQQNFSYVDICALIATINNNKEAFINLISKYRLEL